MGHVTTLVRTEPKEAWYWPDYAEKTLKSSASVNQFPQSEGLLI